MTFTPVQFLAVVTFLVIVSALAGGAASVFLGKRRLALRLTDLEASNASLRLQMERDRQTTVLSRNHFFEELEGAPRTGNVGIYYLDVDDLRSVNYGHGHDTGDRLLTAIAMRLQTLVGDRGFVGRIGGDELCVAIRDSDLFMSDALAEEFRHAVASTCVMVGQQQVSRSASIGVTVLTPEQRLVDALLLGEDAAAQAKSDGRNRVQIANDTILASRAQRRAKPTVEDLRAGLARGEVVYYVQPIWNIRTGQPVGVEALIRWITPNGQVRMPSEFLDTMTANYHLKLKPPLAAANYAARTFTHNRPDLFCTFNISNTFMERYHSLKPQWITDLLQGLQPGQLVFEIVESAVINDPEGAKRVFAALRKSGARVALDDFGKGLSNLERLREYPVDIVKIDQQFIQSLDGTDRNTAIVRGLVEMSRTLGFAIIAEGVETEAQLEQVKSLGIDMVQGFLLGRPATVEHWARQLL